MGCRSSSVGRVLWLTLAAAAAASPAGAAEPARAPLRQMLVDFEKLEVRLEASLAAPLDGRDVRAGVALELARDEKQWWQLGLAYLPLTTRTTITRAPGAFERIVTTQEALAVSLRLFKRLGPLVINGGIVENKVGGGLELRAWQDHLRLELLAHDWSRPDRHPRVLVGGSVQWRWLFVQAGVQDAAAARQRAVFLGGGLRWRDPDLKWMAVWFSRL